MLVPSCYTHSLFISYLRCGVTVLKKGTRGLRAGESFQAEPERVTAIQSGGLAWSRGPNTGQMRLREGHKDRACCC